MASLQEYEDFVLDALEVVEFRLIRRKEDLEDDASAFRPLMAHQIFGEAESIFGYRGLKVQIIYAAGPLHIYLGVKYTERVDELSKGEIKADNVVASIAKNLPDGCYFINMDEFLKTLDKADKFQPFGEKLAEHTFTNELNGSERTFEIYYTDYKVPAFLKFFARLQTFILWFVDAASYIDVDDLQWRYFVCYEKYKNDNGDYQYATVGYTTVYEYYAYPQNIRPRISQMLVLPPFQKLGLGTKLIETIYKYYQLQKSVVDMTVEDPSEDFQRLRNYVDAKLCKELPTFDRALIKQGYTKEMEREARSVLKINPRQCRRVYEIVRLYYTNIHDKEDYASFRVDIKKRLNATYHKQMSDIKKMEKAKMNTELLRAQMPTLEERQKQLQEEFEEVEKQYQRIIDKLKA